MITFLQAAEVAATEEARMGLWELFTKGGWLMWPLLILGGVTIFIFVERFLAIRKASTSRRKAMAAALCGALLVVSVASYASIIA